MADSMLPKRSRLRSREDFNRVFRRGRVLRFTNILCLSGSNQGQETRIGVAFQGKAFRRAAGRHLYKRKLLEALRPQLEALPRGMDIVLLFQKPFPTEKFSEFQQLAGQVAHGLQSAKK